MSATPTRLVVHIGQGKAGSTSIQHTFDAERAALRAQGVAYLGVMLEYCGNSVHHAWQQAEGGARFFHDTPKDVVTDGVYAVLSEEMSRLSDLGVRSAVWSHEAMLPRNQGVIPALARLRDEGVPVTIVAYVRRYDAWARSAYAQWGIRHKTYDGPILTFREWVESRASRFGHLLKQWHDNFGPDLAIRNYDVVSDVVADFMGILDVEGIKTHGRFQATPGPAALVAWAAHNGRSGDTMPTEAFRKILGPSKLLAEPPLPIPHPAELLPSDDDLAFVRETFRDDIDVLNALLRERGEPELDLRQPLSAVPPPDDWEMMTFLMHMVFSLQAQVNDLEKRLHDLGG